MLACSRIHVVAARKRRARSASSCRNVSGGSSASMRHEARRPGHRVLEIVPGDGGDGVGLQADPGHARVRRLVLGEHDRNGAVGPAWCVLAVDAAHDPGRVATVVGPAVDGQRHVDRITGFEDDPVGPLRVDRREEVEGVGVVATPLLVGADDLSETGPGGVGPDVHVGRHLENGEEPLVGLEQAVAVVLGRELFDQPLVGRSLPRSSNSVNACSVSVVIVPPGSRRGPIIGRTLGDVRRAGGTPAGFDARWPRPDSGPGGDGVFLARSIEAARGRCRSGVQVWRCWSRQCRPDPPPTRPCRLPAAADASRCLEVPTDACRCLRPPFAKEALLCGGRIVRTAHAETGLLPPAHSPDPLR